MTQHTHHNHCEHKIEFCQKCDRPYCSKCSKEWYDQNFSWPQYLQGWPWNTGQWSTAYASKGDTIDGMSQLKQMQQNTATATTCAQS